MNFLADIRNEQIAGGLLYIPSNMCTQSCDNSELLLKSIIEKPGTLLFAWTNMNIELIIGILASAFTSISLLPQLIKIIKEKKGNQTSLGMLLILFTGLSLWVVYGVFKKDMIIIISNSIAVLINACTFIMSYIYRNNQPDTN